jgi:hypothetical protein
MKKIVFVFAMFFLGQMTFAQAWEGNGDQKVQVGLNGWGNGSGITATYDYGISKLISVGAGANFYFLVIKMTTKTTIFLHLVD